MGQRFNPHTGEIDYTGEDNGISEMLTPITWAEIKALRDGAQLIPGMYYRITDYTTTVANDTEARSAGHLFDVIVMATSTNTLSEEGKAIRSDRDTDNYFADANLDAWKIWYSLDNDVTRFAWADAENGTGVIYFMKDEWNNECPYDFKNIMFKRYKVTDDSPKGELADLTGQYLGVISGMTSLIIEDENDFLWCYTFNLLNGDACADLTIYKDNQLLSICCENIIGSCHVDMSSDEGAIKKTKILNNNVIQCTYTQAILCGANTFGAICFDNTLYSSQGMVMANKISDLCYNNIVSGMFNTFGNYCGSNTFGNYCGSNTFGNSCSNNTFGNSCYRNTFGNNCGSNTFGNDCYSNTFGNYCYYNTFGNGCYNNTFGNDCDYNTFGNNVRQLTIFEGVQYVSVIGVESGSSYIQNAQILNGTRGENSSNMLQISFQEDAQFCQIAGLKSDGSLRIWTPADGA